MSRATSAILMAIALSLTPGCSADEALPPEQPMCPAMARAGITIEVVDGSTSQRVDQARATITDGSYTESVDGQQGVVAAAWERPGSYAITIESTGYRRWDTTGVVVNSGRCNVEGVQFQARLAH